MTASLLRLAVASRKAGQRRASVLLLAAARKPARDDPEHEGKGDPPDEPQEEIIHDLHPSRQTAAPPRTNPSVASHREFDAPVLGAPFLSVVVCDGTRRAVTDGRQPVGRNPGADQEALHRAGAPI